MHGYAQRTTMNDGHGETRGGEGHGLPNAGNRLAELARQRGVSKAQLNIAWLLHKSRLPLPITGTSSLAHLRENMAAAAIELSAADMAYLG